MNTQEIKEVLLAEKALLEKELAGVAVPDSGNPGGYVGKEPDMNDDNLSDPNEMADEQMVFSNNQSITNDLELKLVDVNKALDALADGTYGTCSVGGNPIESARLEANPAATTCTKHMK